MATKITRRSGPLDKIIHEQRVLSRIRLQAGALGGVHGPSGLNNAEILAIHEYGTHDRHVPPRAPIRVGLAKAAGDLGKRFASGVNKIHAGSFGAEKVAESMGDTAVKAIRKAIRSRLPPDLAEATKAKPGRDPRMIPLEDTGALVSAISAKVKIR